MAVGIAPRAWPSIPTRTSSTWRTLGSNSVSVIDSASNTVVATVAVGSGPYGVAVNPDANLIYVANSISGNVSVIDGASNTVVATVAVGSWPWA